MKLTNLLQINLKKLGQYKLKAMFLILPIAILMTLTIIISSQVANFQNAANQTIFGTIENQSTLINLVKTVNFQTQAGNQKTSSGGQLSFFNSDNQYTSSDVQKVSQIPNVKSASINSQVPISRAITTDLFDNTKYQLSNLVEIDSESASLYTDEDFGYADGQTVIPIILNASTFQEQYEDWGGKTEIEVNFNRGSKPNAPPADGKPQAIELPSPMKTRSINYKKEDLIGKTFTASFGGLDEIPTFKMEQASGSLKFVKLTGDEIATKESDRKTAISKYWDYDKISKPVTYTFKVVGVIESESDSKTYIPSAFSDSLVKNYIQNQLDAKNATAIPNDDLNSTYRGMTYDGTELSSGGFGGMVIRGGAAPVGRAGGAFSIGGPAAGESDSYNIPGLVIKVSEDGSQEVEGVVTDVDVYKNSVKKGQSISIKINSVYDREQVVKDLNSTGYAYTDVDNLEVFNSLRNNLNSISTWFTIAFIALSIAVIIFTMSKFVSESRKEIGIFRAIGMKKFDIVLLFTSQAILYTAIGYLIGVIAGYLLNIISAGAMKNWFDSLVLKTVKETYGVVNNIDGSVFSNISWQTVGYYSLGLLIITLVISLIPAMRASSVSPVEAIKGE